MPTETFTADFAANRSLMLEKLRVNRSFDLISRTVQMENHQAQLYFIDGMVKDDTLNKILELLMKVTPEQIEGLDSARAFADRIVPYGETNVVDNVNDFLTFVLSGVVGMLLEGCSEAILIDVRTYPARPVMEPENDRVLRGAREGFVETLVSNTAMLRRRLRDPQLTMELIQVGERSHTDVVLCYLADRADQKLLERLRTKLRSVKINTLTMGLESLIECTVPGQWWNPFPRARSTERPDCAAAGVAEGQVILLMDNCPAGLILPTGVFDFLQDTNDFCFLPVTGIYLRWLRLLVSILTTVLTPAWYFCMKNPDILPPFLNFIKVHEPIAMPILAQFLIIELVVGALKLASLNTPSALSNSFSVIGALVLGDFAIRAELMVPETVLFMAFVTVANFAQPSYELGYALTFARVLLLIACALFNLWGLLAAGVLILVAISCTKPLSGNCYWYPLLPFNGKALKSLFLRRPIMWENS
ncbi:MAG: spore germination protein [Oscillospiraceae bacterium]|jgi:stage V sporulation protein AF|nr:spore germination protein [Oscillospiraceae bacterium]